MRRLLIAIALFLFLSDGVLAADAKASVRRQTSIPAQSLGSALESLAKELNFQILYRTDVVGSRRTNGVSGQLTPDEALKQLLSGTGLTFRYLNDKAVTIIPVGAASTDVSGLVPGATGVTQVGAINVAQADAAHAPHSKIAGEGVEEMLVEGERDKPAPFSTANIDLTRAEDDPLPFTVFTAREIEVSGAANLEEFLRMRLPQNFSDVIPAEVNGAASDTIASTNKINMRGWGASETVVLVNGRRLPPRYMSQLGDATGATGDFRAIPIGWIERVEILTSAGSALYGEGATGGVVNIILRQGMKGGQFSLQYEGSWQGEAPRAAGDVSYAFDLGRGFTVRVAGSYRESAPLRVGDRADVTVNRWRRLMMQRAPSRVYDVDFYTPPIGGVPNIQSAFTPINNASGSFFITHAPDGYAGGTDISAFREGYDLSLADGGNDSTYSSRATYGTKERGSNAVFAIDKTIAEGWRLSLEYTRTESVILGSGSYANGISGGNIFVDGSVPTNPFGDLVVVSFDDPRLDRPELVRRQSSLTSNIVASLRGSVGQWNLIADLNYSRFRSTNRFDQFSAGVDGDWTAAINSGLYNPFVDMRTVAPAPASFYEHYVLRRNAGESEAQNYLLTLKASGSMVRLPAGAMQLTAGMDWLRQDRDKSVSVGEDIDSLSGQVLLRRFDNSSTFNPQHLFTFDTYSGYAELLAPLLGHERGLPLVHRLDAFLSGRVSYQQRDGFRRIDGRAVEFNTTPYLYSLGLGYEVVEGVALRSSHSIGFKPPTLDQVTPANPPTTSQTVLDRRRNNASTTLTASQYITGGNPDLLPESTTSRNFGFIFTPRRLSGLRLSLDYVENVRDDAIAGIGLQQAIDLESELPGRVQRAAPAPGASAGVITFIDVRNINFRQISSRSLDMRAEKRFDDVLGGEFLLAASAVKQLSFKVQVANNTPPAEQVGNRTAAFSQQLEWNGNVQAGWERRRWSFGWNTRYFDRQLVRPQDFIAQGAEQADATFEHDAFIGYRMPVTENTRGLGGLLSGTSLNLGVKNVFDREPRFWAASAGRGVVGQDSIMGRSVWLSARKYFQ